MTATNADMTNAQLWVPLSEVDALALAEGFYTIDSENLQLSSFHMTHPGRAPSAANRPNGRVCVRHVGGSTAATHTSGATLTRYYPDAPGGGGGSISATFVQLYSSTISGDETAIWDFFVDADSNVLPGLPDGLGLAFNAHGGGSEYLDATEAGVWMLSAYANPNFDATAHVTMHLASLFTPSGGPIAQMADIAAASWGTVTILELSLADIVVTTGPVASVNEGLIYLRLRADNATGTPWSGGGSGAGLTIVRLA